jgi:predicted HTH transcriptional regulator
VPYIERKIAEGEHQQQDFKYAVNDSRKIAITLCAFANTDGGTLLIGVKDNGAVVGVKPEEELHMLEAAAQVYCKPKVEFTTQLWKTDNRYVLEVLIEPSELKPHYLIDAEGKYKAYTRQGDQNLPANAVLLEVWRGEETFRPQRYFHTEKEKKIFNSLETNATLSLSQLVKLTNIPRNIMIKLLARFVRWELIEMEHVNDQTKFKLK